MNTPNPLVPQGSLPQRPPGKVNIRMVFLFAVGVHALVLCGLLIQGCKPKEEPKAKAPEASLPTLPPPDSTTTTPATPATPTGLPAVGTPTTPTGLPPIGGTPATGPGSLGTGPVATGTPTTPTTTTTPVVISGPGPSDAMPSTGATTEHVVAKGDNFSTIAKKYKITAAAISKANPGVDSTKLKVGQKLQIPAPSLPSASGTTATSSAAPADSGSNLYVVKSGDNLGKIAKANGTTIKALREMNGLKTDQIKVGQKLKVPAKGAPASSPTAPPATDTLPGLPTTTTTAIPAIVPGPAPGATPGRP